MSVAGTYNVTTKTPMGDQTGQFVINVDGDTFTGSVSSGMMGTLEVKDGQVSGNTLNWKMDMKIPMPMELKCTATINGDAINGEIDTGAFGKMTMAGTRA